MRDQISITRVNLLHPKWRADAQSFIEDIEAGLDLTFRVAQGLRTFDEQKALYDQGRTKPGRILTYSPAGSSYHNYGLAIDIVPFLPQTEDLDWNFDFGKLRSYAEKYKISLGLDFPHKDSDHFENHYGINWRQLLQKYKTRDFIKGTLYVNI